VRTKAMIDPTLVGSTCLVSARIKTPTALSLGGGLRLGRKPKQIFE